MTGTPLTIEGQQRVVALTRAGETAPAIAVAVGVTERTVQRVRARFGITRPQPQPLTDDEIARAAALLDDGASYTEVARTLGRSVAAMRRAFPGRGWTRAQCYELVATVQRFRGVL